MRITEPRYTRDRSKYDLAYRLLGYAVRPSTVRRWTGLSEYQIQTLASGYHQSVARRRGRAPCQLHWFWRTAQRRQHASILSAIVKLMGVLPGIPCRNIREFSTLARGWRLCRAYQTYVDSVLEPEISFEYAALLTWELCRAEAVKIGKCPGCSAVLILDCLGDAAQQCGYCNGRMTIPAVLCAEATGSVSPEVANSSPNPPFTALARSKRAIRLQRSLF